MQRSSKLMDKAVDILQEFKKDQYTFGTNVLDSVARYAAEFGDNILVVANEKHLNPYIDQIMQALTAFTGSVVAVEKPNSPIEDVNRIAQNIESLNPDCIVAIGGGSTIDAVKAAAVIAAVGGQPHDYFGTDLVKAALQKQKQSLCPIVAVASTAGSGAHLTKYANVTDMDINQKKLIVDETIIPPRAVFDYSMTTTVPINVTLDGVLDGISHMLEVFYGVANSDYNLCHQIVETGLELILQYTPLVLADPSDQKARTALGLATDLGGYAIMIGGTNGAHLNSFSLVDITSHGRACGILNPYYMVFFASAIDKQLKAIADILNKYGFIKKDYSQLADRDLAVTNASGLLAFMHSIGFPTTLKEIPNFTSEHIDRVLSAAKDSQLAMKLANMPIPMTTAMVDDYMRSVLEAAYEGDFSLIRSPV